MIKSSRTRLPVFPLPGVVLLPNSMLPLHIFEYRYREMLADILASTREFIVVNSECDASQSQVGCIAKVIQAQRRPDGRSDIITVGSDRVRINSYFHGKSYLSANFSTLHDAPVHFTQVVSVTALKAAMNQLISELRTSPQVKKLRGDRKMVPQITAAQGSNRCAAVICGANEAT